MSWEAWGDPPEPVEPIPCQYCEAGKVKRNAKGEIEGKEIEELIDCNGEGEIEPPEYEYD